MHFFQLVGAWMFPCVLCATMAPTVATAATTEGASTVEDDSSLSPAFSPGGIKDKVASDPGSFPSSRSSTSSSLLGVRSSSSNSPRSPVSEGVGTAAPTPMGYVVRRCLRKFARKPQRDGGYDERPDGRRRRRKGRATEPDKRGAAAVDGTASEREEAVGSATAYCKETSRLRQLCTRQFAPSLSLDGWLLNRPEEEIGTETAAAHCECEGSLQVHGTATAAVPHHGYAACDAECGGRPSAEEDADPASRRGPAGEQGTGDASSTGLTGMSSG